MHIDELTLYCQDVSAQAAWYRRHGWRVEAPCQIRVGTSILRFIAAPHPYRYHYAIAVPANSLIAVQRWWQTICAQTPSAPYGTIHGFDSWHADALYFQDAAGNIGEFIAQRDSAVGVPATFTLDDVRNICEIGIASSAASTLADFFAQTYHLCTYGDTSPAFYPVGDVDGRFIVVHPDRTWYPDTGVHAHQTPCHITMHTPQHLAVRLTFTTPDALPHIV
jgi:hypothetical protein